MRASWKGTVSFGLVSIPVKVYSAQRDRSVSFTLLHKDCLTPIKYKKWCPKCGREIGSDEIVRGYEIAKGQYVVLTDEDLERIPLKTIKSVQILGFVNKEEVSNPLLFRKVYYIVPDKGGEKPYVLLREAMKRTGKVAIAKVAIRGKEYLALVYPLNHILALILLYYADEITPESELPAFAEPEISEEELKLAEELISMLEKKFVHEEYKDEYKEALEKLIKEKLEGKEIVIPEVKKEEVKELVEALKATVAEIRKKKKQQEG